ncbi:MAG: heme-copper oxidase subunit III [Thermostichales cyanobacterium BF4_bins_65]
MQAEANLSAAQVTAVAHSSHHHHPDLRLFGVKVFLLAESVLFLSLFAAYLTFKFTAPVWPPEGTPERELLLPGLNSLVLIASSFVIHQAEDAIRENDVPAVQKWFGLTALMGMIFLAGQAYEYLHLEFGLTTNLYASSFYVLTGFHGLHVLVGVLLILGVLWRSRVAGHYSAEKHFGIAAAELYWHFVDVIWIILFFLLYIL